MTTPSYQIVLDDQLRAIPVPVVPEAAQAAAAEQCRQELLRVRWVERDDAGLPDDIDRVLVRDRQVGRHNRTNRTNKNKNDNRNWHRDVAARNTVQADRARRVALGYAHPPPKSVFGNRGCDGGVDTHRYARRRYRPAGPLGRASTATACPLPESNQFETAFDVLPRQRTAWSGQGASGAGRQGPAHHNSVRRSWRQAVQQFMGRQNRASPIYAALMNLVE